MDILEQLWHINELPSNMTKCHMCRWVPTFNVSGTLNNNWQEKRWFRQSILHFHFGWNMYSQRTSRERIKIKPPLPKCNRIIRITKITFIPAFRKEKKIKTLFKSIQCTLIIREHLASSNISSQMVFLKDVRKEISNCNLNKYW